MGLDIYPVTVRGPLTTNTSKVVTFARIFVHGDRLYIAESRTKGRTVTQVSSYDLPEGQPTRTGKNAKWGPWVYSSCGCANQWRKHTAEELAALDLTGEHEVEAFEDLPDDQHGTDTGEPDFNEE